jgi:hypothetical protein
MPTDCQIIDLTFRHALIGKWVNPEDATVEYTVSALGDVCTVSGVDNTDGERFVISEDSWDGRELRFTSLMPSTQYEVRHIFHVISRDEVEHEWTRTERLFKRASSDHEIA